MCAKLSLLFLLLIATLPTQAQDAIHLMDGTEQKAIVKTVTPHIITYKRADNPDGPDYTISVNKVDHIAFANGTAASFNELHPKGIRQPHQHLSRRDAQRAYEKKKPPIPELFQVKIAPSSLFDQWGMMLPVYAEYNFARHFGLEAMAAIPFDHLPPITIKRIPTVTRIKSDSKFALSFIGYMHSWKNGHLYLASELMLRYQVLSLANGTMTLGNSNMQESFRSSDLIKTYYGAAIKFGVTARITGNFWFDTYAGIGVIGGNSHHTNTQDLTPPSDIGHEYMFGGYNLPNRIEGSGGAFYMPFAIRLSYHINRTKKQ